MVRKLPVFGMVTPDSKELKIKAVDMPRPPAPDAEYYGQYLQNLQSAAQAYGIDIEMSKQMVKYIENPPAPKKNKNRKRLMTKRTHATNWKFLMSMITPKMTHLKSPIRSHVLYLFFPPCRERCQVLSTK